MSQRENMAFSIRDSLGLSSRGVISLIGAGGKTSLMFGLARELAAQGHTVLSTTTTHIRVPSKKQSSVCLVEKTARDLVDRALPLLKKHPHLSAGSRQIPALEKLKGFDAAVIDAVWESACIDWIIVEADGARHLPIKASDVHEPVIPSCTTAIVHVTGLDSLGTPLDEDHVHRAALFSSNTGLAMGQNVDARAVATSCILELWKARNLILTCPDLVVWLNKADDPGRMADSRAVVNLLKNNRYMFENTRNRPVFKNFPHHSDVALPGPSRVVLASLADPDPVKDVVIL